jgi:PKD repeat protein
MFDASNSQSANPIVSYLWDFGDGTTANAVTVDKTYSAVGVYNVTLTVVDDKDQQGSDNTQITIGEPVPGGTPSIPPPEATAPIPEVTPPEATLTAPVPEVTTPPPEATTPAAPVPEVTTLPPEAITPSPELTPTLGSGGGGALTALIIAIVRDGELQAIFTPGQTVVVAVGQPVEFDGLGSQAGASEIVSYNWSFGDGGTAAEPVVSHTYAAPGTYTASLTVTDATGASNTATSEVQVYGEEPPTPES